MFVISNPVFFNMSCVYFQICPQTLLLHFSFTSYLKLYQQFFTTKKFISCSVNSVCIFFYLHPPSPWVPILSLRIPIYNVRQHDVGVGFSESVELLQREKWKRLGVGTEATPRASLDTQRFCALGHPPRVFRYTFLEILAKTHA